MISGKQILIILVKCPFLILCINLAFMISNTITFIHHKSQLNTLPLIIQIHFRCQIARTESHCSVFPCFFILPFGLCTPLIHNLLNFINKTICSSRSKCFRLLVHKRVFLFPSLVKTIRRTILIYLQQFCNLIGRINFLSIFTYFSHFISLLLIL